MELSNDYMDARAQSRGGGGGYLGFKQLHCKSKRGGLSLEGAVREWKAWARSLKQVVAGTHRC